MYAAWYGKMTPILQQYHEKYACQPTAAIAEARTTYTRYTKYLARKLQDKGLCSHVEYTGSAYEGVKVSNDIEFDIMVIKRDDNLQLMDAPNSGYCYLNKYGSSISPEREVAEFFGTFQKLVNDHPEMPRVVMLRSHGPAVQMDVYRDLRAKSQSIVWFSVDVVLSYRVKKRVFVAKPLKSDGVSQAWRQSYSLEEKELFNGMDRDNGCRKKVLRILKVWRNREPGMDKLTSYHLKTALFHEMKAHPDWSQSELGPRLIGVLRRLHGDMERRRQPHYFDSDINLLDNMEQSTIDNIRDRLQRILRTEQVFTSVFQ